MPRDLYIPPQAMEVFLEAFEGPLDLLLYLIRRQNLNVLDIPIAPITRQYMEYIELMQELQLELAGEYMLMAATLAEIKSRMLLPRSADAERRGSGPARRTGAPSAGIRAFQARRRGYRQDAAPGARCVPGRGRRGPAASGASLPQVQLQEMILAFRDVVSRAAMFAHHHVQRERLSVRERMSDVLASVQKSVFVEFPAAVQGGGRPHGRHGDLRGAAGIVA